MRAARSIGELEFPPEIRSADPGSTADGLTGAIYAQTLPFVEPSVYQVYIDFERALYASIDTGTVRSRRFEPVPEEARQTTT
jgi:hypothetical protein